jgi:hypothetical protein
MAAFLFAKTGCGDPVLLSRGTEKCLKSSAAMFKKVYKVI